MVKVYGVCIVDNMPEDYVADQTLKRGISSNKLISTCIAISLFVFFGVIIAEKNNLFEEFIPTLKGEVTLPDNYVITSIKQRYPILIKKNDPKIADQLRYRGNVTTLFDSAAKSLCTEEDIVAEVGAHYGYNSIMIGNILRNGGKYFAIEGNPNVSKCLHKNVVLNDLSNVVDILNTAVSDHKGTCVINDIISASKSLDGSNSVVSKNITVECDTLSEILKEKKVSLVLINTPRTVFPILRGARDIIEESGDIRLLVNFDLGKVDSQENIRQELMILAKRGLKFYAISAEVAPAEISVDDILEKKNVVVLIKKEK